MANEKNLKPVRSKREARERGKKGGIKSGETRRRKAAMRDTMHRLLTMQAEVEGLSDILRADGGESTYEEIIAMGHDPAGVSWKRKSISGDHEDGWPDRKIRGGSGRTEIKS